METAQLRPLGTVMELIESIGHEVTYAYEDLVFVDHNHFLLQFGQKSHSLDLFINTECSAEEAESISSKILEAAPASGLDIQPKGTYTMDESKDDNLRITFHG
ncbi:MAG: hypothetical protein HGA97_01680 [Chlorobiaceae bacterium]|jgi:hypothetical protein|nr:hypothetical protein [Chlorobiaceae bacterium]